ncbi:WYL domain-containing protein [Paenibacillus typhae]|uniref:WYL domain-containing protein n=1 Tax=Paenibacillus typhae TaxID=1174501 RepID=UPI001C8DDAD7|nr:WYL domain-containing protein [Paenibacillus typhae]MBY0011720.1 WYL domain-containing protein [Paenibacillus typhae]
MNPFEKIFNYRVLSRLEDSGAFLSTSHERSWLKLMLEHPSSAAAFSGPTLDKLRKLLEQDESILLHDHLTHKASSKERQVFHPLLRTLRQCIQQKQGVRLTFTLKDGLISPKQSGLPYRLEYSMVKREWYLLWYSWKRRNFMSVRLSKIASISEVPVHPEAYTAALDDIHRLLESRKQRAVIQVQPEYNRELSRILYAFSCFEKEVHYEEQTGTYSIMLTYLGNEGEYVLSKLRFLGKRVRVTEGSLLKKRMRDSAVKALTQYGVLERPAE